MTREEMKKMIPLAQAFVDGKTIQYLADGAWVEKTSMWFDDRPELYRIKPEPKLRPWKAEEIKLGLEVVYKNNPSRRAILGGVSPDGVWGPVCDNKITFEQLCELYQQVDGSPCGVMEEAL